jgi:enterochelin esterase-like enzyme
MLVMDVPFQKHGYRRFAAILIFALAAAVGARSQERADCRVIHSSILHSAVRYCAYLPASYSTPKAKYRKYPILYSFHGLGGTQQTMALDGEWTVLQDLRRQNKVGEFLVVTPEAWDTFYINSRDGSTRYGDFLVQEFIPFIERTYRVKGTRATRGLTGVSMGGYGALRLAFAHPELFGSVSTHSAAILRERPQNISAILPPGRLAAEELTKVFGDPIDKRMWDLNSPYVLARKNSAELMSMKIYFDCGTEDDYGFYRGATELDQTLRSLNIPHEFHLYPGGHTGAYVLAHRVESFQFHWRAFGAAK